MLEKLKSLFKENNYQNPIIISIIAVLIFAFVFNKPYQDTDYKSKLDSVSTYYNQKVNSLDSVHKKTVESLKSTQKSITKEKEKEISEYMVKNESLQLTISRYRKELTNSKNQFIYIEDGEVRFNDFYAKGSKVVYKKGELENIILANDKTSELKTSIEELNKITKELSSSIEVYRSDSVTFVSVIDSLHKKNESQEEEIVRLSKSEELKTKTNSKYNISITLDAIYDGDVNNNLDINVKKYLLIVPFINSKLFFSFGYENENIIFNPYFNHKAKTGIGFEF